jgi:tetratricopeptide (TPR) repeat protein
MRAFISLPRQAQKTRPEAFMKRSFLLSFLLSLLFLCVHLHSQDLQWNRPSRSGADFNNHQSSVQGQVVNHDGSPVAGVTVRITGTNGVEMATTDDQGDFQFTGLQGGTYDLVAESGSLSAHQTVMLNLPGPQITLRFDTPGAQESDLPRNSVSIQQLKIPDKARKQYEKAVEEAGKQNTEKALSRVSQALKAYPCYADALTLKSLLDLGAGQAKVAADEAQQAIHCDGANGKAYVALGAALNVQQQYQEAIRTLNEGMRFQPDAWQPYYELGKSLLGLNRTADAVSELKRAEALSHDSFPPLHVTLGSALLQMNDYQNARAQFLLFLKAAPDHRQAPRIKMLVAKIDAKLQATTSQVRK